MHRDMGQPSLVESLLPETLGHNERLERIAEAFDWDRFVVKAHVRRPSTAGRGAKSPADPDADWTKTHRGRRTHFGYKVHLGVDAGTGLVRKAVLTPAKVYESEVADGLVSGDERAVYGDRAYESKRRRRWLKSQGINDRIMHRSHKHPPLQHGTVAFMVRTGCGMAAHGP